MGVGTLTFSSYGWPQSWLLVTDTMTQISIYPDGKREGGEHTTKWRIDYLPFIVSVGTAALIASVLSSPLYFWRKKKSDHEPVA